MKDFKKEYCSDTTACPVSITTNVIGGKWKGIILYNLMSGPKRYNELGRLLPHTTKRMLTLQLRELERDGIVHREVYREVPPKVEYSLTALGETLKPILNFMRDWGDKYEDVIFQNREELIETDEKTEHPHE
ncbi:winged helix-turn-helix transcriptional regulator [Alteribacillus iranensis]|uniref:DNA-binding transcriptional regulator, HxlR family n=1 Tax=Alteribacillus iranensis TaxID=930128 RepID=A0A1I2C1D8_9BACI|nr:winged helix-turn-helix transcriptional regulator [Alteribacillus iranensis]SFE62181.1 DNA-binding transcriptional regulator, HxlR family [Alteribacillus iranensis]